MYVIQPHLNVLLLLFLVQLADRSFILQQKEFFVFLIAKAFLNHSPSEWFSGYNKRRTACGSAFFSIKKTFQGIAYITKSVAEAA